MTAGLSGSLLARARAAAARYDVHRGARSVTAPRGASDLLLRALIAAVGVVLLLSIVTRKARNLLLVLVNLPFALFGGVLAMFASGGLPTLGSLVGFVTISVSRSGTRS